MANERSYWVSFRIIRPDGTHIGQGEMTVKRDFPITSERDVHEISQAILKAINEKGSMKEPFMVQAYSWIKFEEPSVVLATVRDMPTSGS